MIELQQTRFSVSASTQKSNLKALEAVLTGGASAYPKTPEWNHVWTESEKVATELRKKFETLIVIGTGGSSLGTQVIAALRPGSRLRFLENVDALGIERLKATCDLRTAAVLIVSKSGGTGETLTGTDFLREEYERQGLDFYSRCHVLTEDENSALGRWSKEHQVGLTRISPEVGGRYSVLSQVGMIPAKFDGCDLKAFREGAAQALTRKEFVAELMGQFQLSFERQEWISFFWFYDPLARILGLWCQQLWAESLGKKTDRQGRPAPRASTPVAGLGTVDQHSVLQQIVEGPRDKFVVFIRSDVAETAGPKLKRSDFAAGQALVGKSMGTLLQVHAIANEQSLHNEGISTMVWKTTGFDERGLGEFFMLMQMLVSGLGEAMGIDPFDQPGVELGKRLAKDLLQKV